MQFKFILFVGMASVLAGQVQAQTSLEPGAAFRDCDECPEMVVVPPGEFAMGAAADEVGRDPNEGPQHQVAINYSFAVGRYEVTVGEFRRFVEATGYRPRANCNAGDPYSLRSWLNPGFAQSDNHPVVCIEWQSAQAFVDWLSESTGASYRLLSEAEWEYVARGGTQSAFSWGNEADRHEMNVPGYHGDERWQNTTPVGTFSANPFGLYDVHGNVWEFTQDCRNRRYRGAPADGSAWQEGDCRYRMARGGSWDSQPREARSASRRRVWQQGTIRGDHDLGFRVARDLD